MKIKTKLTVIIPLLFCASLLIIYFVSILSKNHIIDYMGLSLEKTILNEANSIIESDILSMKRVLSMVTKNEEISQLFYEKNRDALAKMLKDEWEELRKLGYSQFQFHLPPAQSFLRLHLPTRFGDDLSSFRETVIIANREKREVSGIETGVGGLGLREVHPVFHQGKFVGTVELGADLGLNFLNRMQGDGLLYVFVDHQGNRINTLLLKTKDSEDFSNLFDEKTLLSGKTQSIRRGNYLYSAIPLIDFKGNIVAYTGIKLDFSDILNLDNNINTILLVAIIILLALTTVLLLLFASKICNRLLNIVGVSKKISEGNLSIHIDTKGKDEISLLSASFQTMINKISYLIKIIQENAEKLVASAQESAASTQEVTSTSAAVSDESVIINEKAQESTSAMLKTSKVLVELSSLLNISKALAKDMEKDNNKAKMMVSEGRKAIDKTTESIKSIDSSTSKVESTMQALNSYTQKIAQIAQVISNIAKQTGLLALNASIEAARSGEAGKGFAVIAKQVHDLADQSSIEAKNVEELVGKISNEAHKALDATQANKTQVNEGIEIIQNSKMIFEKMFEVIDKATSNFIKIADLTNEQTAESDYIVSLINQVTETLEAVEKHIGNITTSFEEITASMENVASSSMDVSNSSQDLLENTSIFKVKD